MSDKMKLVSELFRNHLSRDTTEIEIHFINYLKDLLLSRTPLDKIDIPINYIEYIKEYIVDGNVIYNEINNTLVCPKVFWDFISEVLYVYFLEDEDVIYD